MICGVGDQKAHTQLRAYLWDNLTKWGSLGLSAAEATTSKYSKPLNIVKPTLKGRLRGDKGIFIASRFTFLFAVCVTNTIHEHRFRPNYVCSRTYYKSYRYSHSGFPQGILPEQYTPKINYFPNTRQQSLLYQHTNPADCRTFCDIPHCSSSAYPGITRPIYTGEQKNRSQSDNNRNNNNNESTSTSKDNASTSKGKGLPNLPSRVRSCG